MSERLLQLGAAFAQSNEIVAEAGEEVIEVSAPASGAAVLYERARTAIDYQEEHLLRRNAILRIIKRYAGSDTTIADISERLLRELIWAKYLPNKAVPIRFVGMLIPIFEKYEQVIRALNHTPDGEGSDEFEWVLQVLATEIEYAITPPVHNEALVSYMYEEMRERVEWDDRLKLSDEQKDLFLYIAVHKTLLRSDEATLRFRVLTLYYPAWPGEATPELIEQLNTHLHSIIKTVDGYINHPIIDRLVLLLRRPAGVFRTLHTAFSENPDNIVKAIQDPAKMDAEVTKALKKRSKEFRTRLRRAVLRAVGFLFITKMLFALVVEAPYEILYLKHTSYLPLIINIFFPPILLSFIALTVGIPERKNTVDYTAATRALMTSVSHDLVNIRVKVKRTNTWTVLFNFAYAATYIVVFGLIAILLTGLQFTWLSITLFLFFMCLVAFFGIRIRSSVKDIILSPSHRGVFGAMFDIFTVPIVAAGRWLSTNVAKINIFIYFFDFILEAPVKVAIRFFEGWTDYIREKREEL